MRLTEKIIEQSYIVSREPYRSLQLDLQDLSVTKDFMQHLILLSEIVRPQELWSFEMEQTDKSVEWILNNLTEKNTSKSGIEIVHKPLTRLSEYEEYGMWDKGYIKGFLEVSGGAGEPDYFIWTYAKMEHLEEILDKWANYFRLPYFYFEELT